jgi:hypothetical protein
VTQAATLSIDDGNIASEAISLYVNQPFSSTSVGSNAPGSGDQIDLSQTSDPAHGLSDIAYDRTNETLSFTFANQIPWNADIYLYQYYLEADGTKSDLFVIQGKAGQAPDYITFISDPGNLTTLPAVIPGSTATPTEISAALSETGLWQLAYNTGVDQYYVRSDIPEPATLGLFALGAGLLGFRRRPRAN